MATPLSKLRTTSARKGRVRKAENSRGGVKQDGGQYGDGGGREKIAMYRAWLRRTSRSRERSNTQPRVTNRVHKSPIFRLLLTAK
eukprot:6186303-Pleurochrysis_carterae.AAC.2